MVRIEITLTRAKMSARVSSIALRERFCRLHSRVSRVPTLGSRTSLPDARHYSPVCHDRGWLRSCPATTRRSPSAKFHEVGSRARNNRLRRLQLWLGRKLYPASIEFGIADIGQSENGDLLYEEVSAAEVPQPCSADGQTSCDASLEVMTRAADVTRRRRSAIGSSILKAGVVESADS